MLFHGQGFIERGFSINADVIDHNMQEKSIVSRRLVCDAVSSELSSKGIDDPKAVQNVAITKEMLRYCRLARSKYENYLDEKKDQQKEEEMNNKKREVREKLRQEKKKLEDTERNIKTLLNEADELAMKAEKKNNFSYIRD